MKDTKKRSPVATDTPERTSRLEFLKKAVHEFKAEDFGTPETGSTLTADFGKAPKGGKPEAYPQKGAHPRVLFNEKDIPGIAANVENNPDSLAVKKFKEYLTLDLDGKLGEAYKQYRGWINLDLRLLSAIQAQALAYAVYGDEYYGYTAIYALLNFMATLDYNFKQIDQTRDFGAIIYTAACVYDWCYDLLSDATMRQILLGVEHIACRGYVDEPEKVTLTSPRRRRLKA